MADQVSRGRNVSLAMADQVSRGRNVSLNLSLGWPASVQIAVPSGAQNRTAQVAQIAVPSGAQIAVTTSIQVEPKPSSSRRQLPAQVQDSAGSRRQLPAHIRAPAPGAEPVQTARRPRVPARLLRTSSYSGSSHERAYGINGHIKANAFIERSLNMYIGISLGISALTSHAAASVYHLSC